MSSNVSSLIAAIKTRVAAVASTYSEISYAKDLSKNSFKGNFKRYGVIPLSSNESSSVTRALTVDQSFQLILTDGFINTAMSDSSEQAASIALQDLANDIYIDLVNTKAGSSSICLQVYDLSLDSPETLQDQSVVIQKSTFKIKYRINL